MLAVCAALLQLTRDPLAGGIPSGGSTVPLERATGGDTPVLTPEAARRLGLRSEPMPPARFGLADQLTVGSAEALVMPVGALPPGVDGVLGEALLKRLPVWIDPVGQRLRLGEGAVALAAPAPPRRTLPLARRLGPIEPGEPPLLSLW